MSAGEGQRPTTPPETPTRDSTGVPLYGGTANRGLVTRHGDTVRRPQPAAAEAVHALLGHLQEVGFDGAPRFLGVDEEGREVLSFVPGEAAVPPYDPWELSDAALVSVAELLRRYHDAVATFDPAGLEWATSVPSAFRSGLVCHNDPNLDNVVFRDGKAVALIDFDLASPGSAVWDIAIAVRLWVPLRAPEDVTDQRAGAAHHRLRLFVDAYGLPRRERTDVVEAAIASFDWCYGIVAAGAAAGSPGYQAYWSAGTQARAARGRRWAVDHGASLSAALRRQERVAGG